MPTTRQVPDDSQFIIVYRNCLAAVSRSVLKLLGHPLVFIVLSESLNAMDHNTGIVRLEKQKLALSLDVPLDEIETSIGLLQDIGVLYETPDGWKPFEKLAVNPRLAWKGKLTFRESRMSGAPPCPKPLARRV